MGPRRGVFLMSEVSLHVQVVGLPGPREHITLRVSHALQRVRAAPQHGPLHHVSLDHTVRPRAV